MRPGADKIADMVPRLVGARLGRKPLRADQAQRDSSDTGTKKGGSDTNGNLRRIDQPSRVFDQHDHGGLNANQRRTSRK